MERELEKGLPGHVGHLEHVEDVDEGLCTVTATKRRRGCSTMGRHTAVSWTVCHISWICRPMGESQYGTTSISVGLRRSVNWYPSAVRSTHFSASSCVSDPSPPAGRWGIITSGSVWKRTERTAGTISTAA